MRFSSSLSAINSALFTLALIWPHYAAAQQFVNTNTATKPAAQLVGGAHENEALRILYTGRLMGYFRCPDRQPPDKSELACSDTSENKGSQEKTPNSENEPSVAAREFDELMNEARLGRVILVGTGDNFAPEIEARQFSSSPLIGGAGCGPTNPRYPRLEKEFFSWDGKQTKWNANECLSSDLRESLKKGEGYIPDDNVASFLLGEGYAAIVPGKHDFYFGAERLRELAWLLASKENQSTTTIHSHGVQMLGANLVLETTWKKDKDHEPLSDRKDPPWFIPRFPTANDLAGFTDLEIKLSGLSDGDSVYPWFQGPTFSLTKPDAALEGKVKGLRFWLCDATIEGDPNSFADPSKLRLSYGPHAYLEHPCTPLEAMEKEDGEAKDENAKGAKGKTYQLRFKWVDETHWSTLLPGKNYGLCVNAPDADQRLKDKNGRHIFCVRFSTYTPLLQYPATHVDSRVPPDPFILLPKDLGLAKDVAIFGAIDPHLGDYVGFLNLAWSNDNKHYKTQAAVKDPAEALKQLDDYFEQKYRDEHDSKSFDGIKILLAQMSPQEAEVLATRVPKYHVVVSAADAEKANIKLVSTTQWQPEAAQITDPTKLNAPPATFLAVPEPFYVDGRKAAEGGSWAVDIGSLSIHLPPPQGGIWRLKSRHLSKPVKYASDSQVAPTFWTVVRKRLGERCLSKDVAWATNPGEEQSQKQEQIQLLTLCAMQQYAEADIAMLQKRDLFATLPGDTKDVSDPLDQKLDAQLQQILERIIWKGDFLVVKHIPGSVILKVMEQSKSYDKEDKSLLSLSDERNRGLVYVGIRHDDEQDEYLINGIPLDPNKLYSVVTSDYISAGDTGFKDLAAEQLDPPATPRDLDNRLLKISSVVSCARAGTNGFPDDCLDKIARKNYFDEIAQAPRNTQHVNTPLEQFESWLLQPHPPVPGDPSLLKPALPPPPLDAAQKKVEQRPLWDLALSKLTLGITALSHNHTDYDVQNDFGGVSAPGVNAVRSTIWASDMQTQYTRNWQYYQLLLTPAYTYNTQYKGQPDDFRQVNQQADLGMFDIAAVRLWNGRGPEHFDSVLDVHFETPLARIFNAFTLGTAHTGAHGEQIKDQLRFAQNRSYTTLVRPGIRWKRRKSSADIGPEWGHEWNALDGFTFVTNGLQTPCPATATVSISQCVKNAVKANPQSITPISQVLSERSGHDHGGMYWKLNLTVPFHPKVSYVLTDTGDWFFVHYHTDNSTDTRFRDVEQHQLKLDIFPSLSIGPEIDFLFYENSSSGPFTTHFLRQDVLMMKAQFSFDLFNGRKAWQQIKYAPPTTAK
jgi:2',3'-cyclic-nucleotide 2'-phosphodiesterase (5'-nucleotidase family)